MTKRDPIFAAIEARLIAERHHIAACTALGENDASTDTFTTPEQRIANLWADVVAKAQQTLLSVQPSTRAGFLALADHLVTIPFYGSAPAGDDVCRYVSDLARAAASTARKGKRS